MTPVDLGCFGSHNSWQVVSWVAGLEANRDGPRLSDNEAGLTLVRNWDSDRSHWVGNPGCRSVPAMLSGDRKSAPLFLNFLIPRLVAVS